MKSQIPKPKDFGVSENLGFLSDQAPLEAFQQPYFKSWDELISKLPSLLTTGSLEKEIAALPLLSAANLASELDYRRAYVVLAYLIHANIWSKEVPNPRVPSQLAEPFLAVCAHLGMEPVLSYAGICLWNWKYISNGVQAMGLQNLTSVASFTGTQAEDAFNLVPVLTEAEGGYLVAWLVSALDAAKSEDTQAVVVALDKCADSLVRMAGILPELYSQLDAHMFYHVLRPYYAGGKGMEEKGLPRGIVFQKSDGSDVAAKCVGGSAVQSSLFPFLDYALGVVHKPMDGGSNGTIFQEMRAYMPGKHRIFLKHMSNISSIRNFVEKHSSNQELSQSYNNCLKQLRSWRSKHIAVVSKYVVQPARAAAKAQVQPHVDTNGTNGHTDFSETNAAEAGPEIKGTGGSALIPFLKQARDETTGID